MKKLKLAILAILCAAVGTSCSTEQQILRHEAKCNKWGVCQPVQNDTIYTEKIAWDTVKTDNSEFWSAILFECDSMGAVHIKQIDSLSSRNIALNMALKDNKLVQHIYIPAKVIRVPKLMTSLKTNVVVERFTNILTGWQSFQIWSGRVLWIGLIIFVGGWVVRIGGWVVRKFII